MIRDLGPGATVTTLLVLGVAYLAIATGWDLYGEYRSLRKAADELEAAFPGTTVRLRPTLGFQWTMHIYAPTDDDSVIDALTDAARRAGHHITYDK